MSTIQFVSPRTYKESVINVQAFKLESEPKARCYVCHCPLSDEEKRHKSIFKYYDTDGNAVGTVETYVCFDCIKIITGEEDF